jgi:mono/diheme cytochrome c family protein
MKRLIVVCALALVGCGREGAIVKLTGDAVNGGVLFTNSCATCHGADGKGTTSGVNLHEPAKNDSQEEIVSTILNGRPGTAMPAWGNTYSDQQIANLYAYVKTSFGQ